MKGTSARSRVGRAHDWLLQSKAGTGEATRLPCTVACVYVGRGGGVDYMSEIKRIHRLGANADMA